MQNLPLKEAEDCYHPGGPGGLVPSLNVSVP